MERGDNGPRSCVYRASVVAVVPCLHRPHIVRPPDPHGYVRDDAERVRMPQCSSMRLTSGGKTEGVVVCALPAGWSRNSHAAISGRLFCGRRSSCLRGVRILFLGSPNFVGYPRGRTPQPLLSSPRRGKAVLRGGRPFSSRAAVSSRLVALAAGLAADGVLRAASDESGAELAPLRPLTRSL